MPDQEIVATPVLVDTEHDQRSRWRPGERLPDVYAEIVLTHGEDAVAVDTGGERITFGGLARRARRLARHLAAHGVRPGERVALLLDDPTSAYVATLAVGLLHAAYVPLDAGFPADRVAFIVDDAGARTVVTTAALAGRLDTGDRRCGSADTERLRCHTADAVEIDTDAAAIAARDDAPLSRDETGEPVDELAYLVYTSGTTGRPKGVAIEHAAIVNFVRVAAETYGLRRGDRVYQGMTLAFDFSIEELWVPWVAGATVVPKPAGATLLGEDLQRFLVEREVTALCCVPTLLATLDEDALEGLRFLLVSGEACPPDLVTRWHRGHRRFLNVYGPTEATVTATATAVHPDRAVTLGRPLPTYSLVLLDPDSPTPRPVPDGEPGEIAIAGIGLARGYLGLDEKTAAAFVPDTIGMPNNPSGRIYRTGDLGVVTADGEVEYRGRIDTQVKIRGYRIELTEIESVLLSTEGVAAAVVDTWEPTPGVVELVGYLTSRVGTDPDGLRARARERLRDRLPAYMVPPYLEHLDAIPLTTSDKADRANLPAPMGPRAAASATTHTDPATDTERVLAAALGPVLGAQAVSTTAHVLDELGASSLLLARFASAAREAGRTVSISDVYRFPTVAELAAELDGRAGTERVTTAPRERRRRGSLAFAATGVAQLAFFVAYLWGVAAATDRAYDLVAGGGSFADQLLRALAVGAAALVVLAVGPVVLKWVLVGRWRETEVPLWGVRYLRFWIVRTLVRFNVMVLFMGTPLYSIYLRALGARVGRHAVVLTRNVPVCTDLISIGAGTVVRKDTWLQGYAPEGGVLRTGRVTIGARAFVGEGSVLDIGTSMGDDTQLAHASALPEGGHVPDGERWHGSPAEPAGQVDFQRLDPTRLPTWKRAWFGTVQALQFLVVVLPLAFLAIEGVVDVGVGGGVVPPVGSPGFFLDALVLSALSFFGLLAVGLAAAVALPRLLRRLVVPGRTYPLYSLRYSLQRAVTLSSNRRMFNSLFGDSSAITGYLRALGWDLGRVEQTGSNFGTTQKQDAPSQSRVGRGTMISDGISMANVEFSSTGFRVAPAEIGARNFLGNKVVYPSGGRTGDNVLLATKVMVPLDGERHHDTGLLGSPAFTIPRAAHGGERPTESAERDAALPRKNRHNTASMIAFLLARWGQVFFSTLIGLAAVMFYPGLGALAIALASGAALVVSTAWLVLVERAAMGFRRLRPRSCSIYDPYFWRHERLWKLLVPALATFDGTPVKPWLLRALGVRVGHRLFDDGAVMPEHSLVTLGDDVMLGAGSTIQCHSLEDGAFTSEHTALRDRVTIGTNAFVHYGVTLHDGAVLDADSFLMKGSDVPAGTRWRGNPAGEA